MKDEILNLFMEILEEWEIAEDVVINESGELDNYEELSRRKDEYIKKINELIKKIN